MLTGPVRRPYGEQTESGVVGGIAGGEVREEKADAQMSRTLQVIGKPLESSEQCLHDHIYILRI